MTNDVYEFRPIGIIHSPLKEPAGAPVQGALAMDIEAQVEIFEPYREGLSDLGGFSHAMLIFFFNRSKGYKMKVIPYLDDQLRGLFATRAPRRPNNIGVTVVRLLEVGETGMRIAGVDMLDQTPLLDIKPYVPLFDEHEETSFGWLEPHLKARAAGDKTRHKADGRFHEK
jgi:tRNA (adenine37-N6)-methyltransferase